MGRIPNIPGESRVDTFVVGVGVGALGLIVALETPNVSKCSSSLFLTLRRLAIEAVSSSFAVSLIRSKVTLERSDTSAGAVDTEIEVDWSPLSLLRLLPRRYPFRRFWSGEGWCFFPWTTKQEIPIPLRGRKPAGN